MTDVNSGSSSGGDKWTDAIDKAEDHVRLDETEGPPAPRPLPGQTGVMLFIGLVVAVVVAVVSPRLLPGSSMLLPTDEQAADLRAEVAMLVEQIEAYRDEYRRLPDPAVLVPFLDEGYEYRVTDPTTGQYVVRRSAGGVEVEYDGTLALGLWLVAGGSNAQEPG